MVPTTSKLRQDICRILDPVAETGAPVEIVRRRLKIVAAEGPAPRKIQRLKVRPKVLIGDPQRLVHMDWSKEWKP